MENKNISPEEYFLVYFDRLLLARYRAQPDRYTVFEDDMGGELKTIVNNSEESISDTPYFLIRFGFRKLPNGKSCLAVFGPDLKFLPEQEKNVFIADRITPNHFQSIDLNFDRWRMRNLHGSWESSDGPITNIEQELMLIQSLTNCKFQHPLFRTTHNPSLRYPVAENTEALLGSRVELHRLIIDGLDDKSITLLAKHSNKEAIINGVNGTLNKLKNLLPSTIHAEVHNPLKLLSKSRNKIHGVPSRPHSSTNATEQFDKELRTILRALSILKNWLQSELILNADACLKREQAMQFFPHFTSKLRPAMKHDWFEKLIGKTIQSIECGGILGDKNCHTREALILHFNDGTSCAIDIGSNAGNVAMDVKGVTPNMFDADLTITWAPNPSQPLDD